ncbi:MAG: hypothetical protein KatS3mg061_1196 [Dehalococcoidia bacterium]|nr:MAG: hypothetical protein KatS3mg061_1196 [Dehalococcoidia bacterium]
MIDDGRNFLLLRDQQFDIIEADPILPRNAGAANLYSADFYRLVRSRLRDDGVFVQWVDPTLPLAAHQMMVRTFLSVFPRRDPLGERCHPGRLAPCPSNPRPASSRRASASQRSSRPSRRSATPPQATSCGGLSVGRPSWPSTLVVAPS